MQVRKAMKKFFVILLILLSLFSLSACKNNNNEGEDDPIVTDSDNVLETIANQIKEIFR
jgi:thioredoxin-related protein